MRPYIVLATYKPVRWNAPQIGRDLTAITAEHGLVPHNDPAHGPLSLAGKNWVSVPLHAEVRRRTFRTKQAEDWHYDADLCPDGNPDSAIVLWASNHPTEIRWRSQVGKLESHSDAIYQPVPYELVIFKNLSCLHRRPSNAPFVRWVFRQRVAVPGFLNLP